MAKKDIKEIAFNIEVGLTEFTIILWIANFATNILAAIAIWLFGTAFLLNICTWMCAINMLAVAATAFASLKSDTNISTACCIGWFSVAVVALNGILTFGISFMTPTPFYELGIPCIIMLIVGIATLFISSTENTEKDLKKRKKIIEKMIKEEEDNAN